MGRDGMGWWDYGEDYEAGIRGYVMYEYMIHV